METLHKKIAFKQHLLFREDLKRSLALLDAHALSKYPLLPQQPTLETYSWLLFYILSVGLHPPKVLKLGTVERLS